jgi:hypothetical protein
MMILEFVLKSNYKSMYPFLDVHITYLPNMLFRIYELRHFTHQKWDVVVFVIDQSEVEMVRYSNTSLPLQKPAFNRRRAYPDFNPLFALLHLPVT